MKNITVMQEINKRLRLEQKSLLRHIHVHIAGRRRSLPVELLFLTEVPDLLALL